MAMKQSVFGKTTSGETVTRYEICNKNGMTIQLIDYGAILVSVLIPDGNGNMKDVVLGYDSVKEYEENPPHFGAVIGRGANRIEHGIFQLNGTVYQLGKNNNGNNLHSGPDLYEHRMWQVTGSAERYVTFTLQSPAMDQGFPGNLEISVTYELTDENEVILHYTGIADEDTVVNMTNHSYFNLSGHDDPSIMDHMVWINAERFTPVKDEKAIPNGIIQPVKGTPMDFTETKEIAANMDMEFEQLKFTGGYDHNYVLNQYDKKVRPAAKVSSPKSGISMEVLTDTPGIQFYIGNFIKGPAGKGQIPYHPRQGLCLETQYFPNSVNEPAFESPVLKKGQNYDSTTIYRFRF